MKVIIIIIIKVLFNQKKLQVLNLVLAIVLKLLIRRNVKKT